MSKKAFTTVSGPRQKIKDLSPPLKVREQWIDNRRYIVCYNEEQARKDAADNPRTRVPQLPCPCRAKRARGLVWMNAASAMSGQPYEKI